MPAQSAASLLSRTCGLQLVCPPEVSSAFPALTPAVAKIEMTHKMQFWIFMVGDLEASAKFRPGRPEQFSVLGATRGMQRQLAERFLGRPQMPAT